MSQGRPGRSPSSLKIMVLAGGPDRERPVSLVSGQQVAQALEQAGHQVRLRDILPTDLSALDEFVQWGGQVLFPAMHGSWGEGGGLQTILDERRLPYFGCGAAAGDLCMDKHRTKVVLRQHGLPTPAWEIIRPGQPLTMPAPLVLKPLREGSSIDVAICKTAESVRAARADLEQRHPELLAEAFIDGLELTCGVIGGPEGDTALPPVQIIPATDFYDYQAKYLRDDTRYVFDIPLPADMLATVRRQAVAAFAATGCRHLARVDFMVDARQGPLILEINTIPGFTSHSLVPKSAAHVGIAFAQLCDRLARLALTGRPGPGLAV